MIGSFLPGRRMRDPGFEWFLVALVVVAGIAFRWKDLDSSAFWCDEAESSINALTILQHGYPSDHYLGLPIFENTLVRPWPENPEYEFKDVSYSDKGVAVYHAWLPLYSIAASLALHHIQPDPPGATQVQHSAEEWKRRTRAGRIPAVLYGGLFLVVAFLAGRTLYGADAGWIALLARAFDPWHTYLSRQARYYSATIAISTICCLMVWLMVTRSRWKDFIAGGFFFVLLFHTHLLSFAVACAVLGLLTPLVIYRNPRNIVKLAAFGAVVAAGALPWLVLTGFVRHQGMIPRAWSLLSLPGDLIRFPPAQPLSMAIPALFLCMVALVHTRRALPGRLQGTLDGSVAPLLFLGLWCICGYAAFLLFMPAGSFYRHNMSYWGPAALIVPLIVAAVVRIARATLTRPQSPLRSPLSRSLSAWSIAAGLLLMARSFQAAVPTEDTKWRDLEGILNGVRALPLRSATRLYATPNDHLILSFYSGLPFQSIMPIRKSFLDRYSGDIVLVVRNGFDSDTSLLQTEELQTAAARNGVTLSGPDARKLSAVLRTHDYRQTVNRDVTGAPAVVEPVPPFADAAFRRYREQRDAQAASLTQADIMMRGFSAVTIQDCFEVFFYRFVDPDSRRGPNLNYAGRLRGSKALVLADAGAVIYYSPGGSRPPDAGIDYRFLD